MVPQANITLPRVLVTILMIGASLVVPLQAVPTKEAMRIPRDECMNCHKPGKARGGLLLHQREKALEGGDLGPAIVPGKLEESLLYELVLADADPHMPPKKQLSDEQISQLKDWILAGAPWDLSVFDELPPANPVTPVSAAESYQPALALALSPDQTKAAIAKGGQVYLVEIQESDVVVKSYIDAHVESVQSLAWHPDGKRLFTGGFQRIRVWNTEDFSQQHEFHESLLGAITTLAVSHDGNALIASDGPVGGAGFLHRFDLNTSARTHSWKGHDDTIYSSEFSPDGTQLLTASADKTVKLWNAENQTLISTFEGHTSQVLTATFDLDGKRIASAGTDQEIKLWNVEKVEQIISLSHTKDPYVALDWIEKDDSLVAIPETGIPSLYSEFVAHNGEQSSSGTKRKQLVDSRSVFTGLKATRDGTKLLGSTFKGYLVMWNLASSEPKQIPLTPPPPPEPEPSAEAPPSPENETAQEASPPAPAPEPNPQ